MIKVIAISGPSSTGKTTLIDTMRSRKELKGAYFSPDLYNTVWSDLVDKGTFYSYDEIIRDSEYLSIYILRVLNYYEDQLSVYEEESEGLLILDCCWIDILVYALINMWCTKPIKTLQEDIIERIHSLHNSVDMIYLTQYDSSKKSNEKFREECKIYSVKDNRKLEFSYYKTLENFYNVKKLTSSNPEEASTFIIEDLKKLGYL